MDHTCSTTLFRPDYEFLTAYRDVFNRTETPSGNAVYTQMLAFALARLEHYLEQGFQTRNYRHDLWDALTELPALTDVLAGIIDSHEDTVTHLRVRQLCFEQILGKRELWAHSDQEFGVVKAEDASPPVGVIPFHPYPGNDLTDIPPGADFPEFHCPPPGSCRITLEIPAELLVVLDEITRTYKLPGRAALLRLTFTCLCSFIILSPGKGGSLEDTSVYKDLEARRASYRSFVFRVAAAADVLDAALTRTLESSLHLCEDISAAVAHVRNN